MTFLSRDELLARWKRRETVVALADGTTIPIREVSIRDRIDAETAGDADPETLIFRRPSWFAATLVQRAVLTEPNGPLLFTSEDVPLLAEARGYGWATNEMEGIATQIRQFSEVDSDSFRRVDPTLHSAGNPADDDGAATDPGSDVGE